MERIGKDQKRASGFTLEVQDRHTKGTIKVRQVRLSIWYLLGRWTCVPGAQICASSKDTGLELTRSHVIKWTWCLWGQVSSVNRAGLHLVNTHLGPQEEKTSINMMVMLGNSMESIVDTPLGQSTTMFQIGLIKGEESPPERATPSTRWPRSKEVQGETKAACLPVSYSWW